MLLRFLILAFVMALTLAATPIPLLRIIKQGVAIAPAATTKASVLPSDTGCTLPATLPCTLGG